MAWPMTPAHAAVRAIRTAFLAAETFGHARSWPANPAESGDASHLRQGLARLKDAARAALGVHDVHVTLEGEIGAGPAVLVANHRSWFDPLVLLSLRTAVPFASHEVESWSVAGPLFRDLGCLFVERGCPTSGAVALRRALRALACGTSIVGFPEATMSRRGVLPFHRGLFGLARIAGVPVIPLSIEIAGDRPGGYGQHMPLTPRALRSASASVAAPPDWWQVCSRGRVDVTVKVGAAMVVPKNLSPSLAAARARSAVIRLLDDTPPLGSVFAQSAWSVPFDGVTP